MRKIRFIYQKEYPESLDVNKWKKILEEASSLNFNSFSLKILDNIEDKKLKEFLDLVSNHNFLIELEDNSPWNEGKRKVFIESNVHLFWLTFYSLKENKSQENLEKINYLRSKSLPIGFRYILTKENFNEVFDLPGFLKNIRYCPRQFILEEISPLEGKNFNRKLLIEPKQLKLYFPFIKKYILGFPHRLNPNAKIYSNYQDTEYYPFISGEEIIIEGNGDVHPFPFLNFKKAGNVFSDSILKVHERLNEELNELTLEKAEKGKFLNWFSVISDCPKLKETNFQDINRVILPDSFNILMTNKCNFKCDFCEFDCKPEDTEAIDIKDFEKLLKEGKQLGISRLIFDGGEPLLHPDIKKAFKIVKDLDYSATILTNGWHFKDFLEDYKKANINNFIFGLYGASSKSHDKIVDKEGAFDKCVSAIKLSKELGYLTGLHTVLHPLSFHELDKFFDLAEEWKIDYIMISSITPVGRAKNNQNLVLSEDQKKKISKIYQNHHDFLSKITFQGYQPQPGQNLSCKYLNRSGPLGVYWNGSIALCSMLPLLNLPFLKIKDHNLIGSLIFMNKINELFQTDRKKEFSAWCLKTKKSEHCLYCHEKLSKKIGKYISS